MFVVGYLGDWRPAAAVLFDRESLLGNPAPCRRPRQNAAPNHSAHPSADGVLGTDFDPGGRPVSAYVLGLAFGFGWTPCIGPILGAILTASAATATLGQGMTLLAVYSAGLGIPFLVIAGFTDRLSGRLRRLGRIGRRLHQIAGIVMIGMGIAMMTGRLSALSYWLLETFPALARIG